MRAPYQTKIKGPIMTVTENEKSIMMKDTALEVIKTTILGEKSYLEEEQNKANKKARTNTAAVPTGRGQNGFGATQFTNGRDVRQNIEARQFTNGRDVRQNIEARQKNIASLKAKAKTIKKTLSMIVKKNKV
jgi:hypothetical protein